jgi:nicotinamide mononucleotide transporter
MYNVDLVVEIAVVSLNLLYLICIISSKRVGWLLGVAGSALFVYANIQQHLYMDVLLNLYYVGIGIYGWWAWGEQDSTLPISRMPIRLWLVLVAVAVGLIGLIGSLMQHYTDNTMPYIDALVTVLSFIATWMAARRYIDNWWVWILVDPIAAALYYAKGGMLYPILFVIYTLLAIYGYYLWQKEQHDYHTNSHNGH